MSQGPNRPKRPRFPMPKRDDPCASFNGIPYDYLRWVARVFVDGNCFDCGNNRGEYIIKERVSDGIEDCVNGSDESGH